MSSSTLRYMAVAVVAAALYLTVPVPAPAAERHLLYVAEPGIRNDVKCGGIGILVFDMDDRHRFLRRIPTLEVGRGQTPEAVKGICANTATRRIYLTTPLRLVSIDLDTEKILWNRTYDGG